MSYINGQKLSNINLTILNLTEQDKVDIANMLGVPATTDDKYFRIEEQTESGCIISLKPEYRGAAYKRINDRDLELPTDRIPLAISDNGAGIEGSQNYELPSEIHIPLTVNGIAVVGLAKGTFAYNERIKRIVLHSNIKELNGYTFCRMFNLEELECIKQITTVGAYEFAFTRLKKIELPNLVKAGGSAFRDCPFLEYVDVGCIPTIGNYAFHHAYNLREIKIANPVTSVGHLAFWRCFNLQTVDNIVAPSVTISIGDGAFFLCRPTYDWDALAQNGCTFGTHATSNQVHANKFWLQDDGSPILLAAGENKPTPCLLQDDLRWQDTVYNNENGDTFAVSCEGMCVMGIWCALNNVNVDDARDYLDICLRYGTEFKDINYGIYDTSQDQSTPINNFYSKMGLKPYGYTSSGWGKVEQARTNLQAISQAIADGKYVILTIPNNLNDGSGHVVVVSGITPQGELIVQDPAANVWALGTRGYISGRVPIQNLINTVNRTMGIQGVILSKKAVT